jgi:hypothetical protein
MKLVEKSVVASRFNLQTAIGLLIAIAILYLAREVLIPIALALLLSFLLRDGSLTTLGAGKEPGCPVSSRSFMFRTDLYMLGGFWTSLQSDA